MSGYFRTALSGLLVVAIALLACKQGSVEGKYDLHKPSMKAAMEKKIASLPAGERDMAKLGLAIIDMLEMSIELKEDKTAVVNMSMAGMEKGDKPKMDTKQGKWTQKDDKITITVDGDDEPLNCTHSGGDLTCAGDDDMEFVLKKAD